MNWCSCLFELELVYLPKGKYCVYPRMVYRLAIVMPPPPFWMTENHFRLHFSPLQINTQLLFIFDFAHKMAASGHFGWPKITFDRISRHCRSIRNFFSTKWLPAAILEVRFGPFWMTENHFRSHFSPFQINTQLFCWKSDLRQKQWVLPLCVINHGYAKYEVDRWIYDTFRDATSSLSIFIQNSRQRPFCFFRLIPKIIRFL